MVLVLSGPIANAYVAFTKYLETLKDIIERRIPIFLVDAGRLVDDSVRVKDEAEPEFEALGTFGKGKAVIATGNVIRLATKIPGFI